MTRPFTHDSSCIAGTVRCYMGKLAKSGPIWEPWTYESYIIIIGSLGNLHQGHMTANGCWLSESPNPALLLMPSVYCTDFTVWAAKLLWHLKFARFSICKEKLNKQKALLLICHWTYLVLGVESYLDLGSYQTVNVPP